MKVQQCQSVLVLLLTNLVGCLALKITQHQCSTQSLLLKNVGKMELYSYTLKHESKPDSYLNVYA